MAQTALARKDEPTAVPPSAKERLVPEIDPRMVKEDRFLQYTRLWHVTLPPGFEFSDLADTKCWRRAQANASSALRREDEVRLKAYDRSWQCRCIVTDANQREASLSKPFDHVEMKSRLIEGWSDGRYRIDWFGTGFAGVEIATGQKRTEIVGSEALARIEIKHLYGQPL